MSKTKQLFKSARVILLIAFIILSVIVINPRLGSDGVAIRTVLKNSVAASATPHAFVSPEPNSLPRSREVITSINNRPIIDEDDYYAFTKNLEPNRSLLIKTNKASYRLTTVENFEVITLPEQEEVEVVTPVFDNETNTTVNVTSTKLVNKTEKTSLGTADIGLKVYDAPVNNIQKGLDLAGGTRVLLQPEETVTDDEVDFILENIRQRLNVYGLSDIAVKKVVDFTGDMYILVEIAGASQEEVTDLLSKQGKFEAKIGDLVVFNGGNNDIVYVDKSATGSGLDPQRGCHQSKLDSGEDGYVCGFRFAISLSPDAAQRQADATGALSVVYNDLSGKEGYLSKNLTLYLDGELVNELRIGSSLRGNVVSDISISGSGFGTTRDAASKDALQNMKELQTVMQTGSLPVKLDIIQSDSISPVLGDEFIKNTLIMALFAFLAVALVVSFRYRRAKIALPVIITMASEVLILLGFAVIVKWQLDLAAIAGILIAVGTGVDDQIVIIDETLNRTKAERRESWKKRLKRAFFIIMTSYFTTVVAMIPLLGSGAGLLKGFALTTIAGVSIGVFITRPAFAKMIEVLLAKKEELIGTDDDD